MELIYVIFVFKLYLFQTSNRMNCVIDNVINTYLNQGKKLEVIRRYISMKYRIYIDLTSLKERIKLLKLSTPYQQ